MRWNPGQYLAFGSERARPALDLLARVRLDQVETAIDLGCGAGGPLAALARRWPEARITGLDTSAEMLAAAKKALAADLDPGALSRIDLVRGDAGTWAPDRPLDLIYSNAALHWVDDHPALFARLMGFLRPGGVLAVQMPRNSAEPSHTELADLAGEPRWRDALGPRLRPVPVAEPGDYDLWLSPFAAALDIWETIYHQRLTGERPVFEWVKGAALVPLLSALKDEAERRAFEDAYAGRLARAYPRRADGITVFPFRRLFLVAVRK